MILQVGIPSISGRLTGCKYHSISFTQVDWRIDTPVIYPKHRWIQMVEAQIFTQKTGLFHHFHPLKGDIPNKQYTV